MTVLYVFSIIQEQVCVFEWVCVFLEFFLDHFFLLFFFFIWLLRPSSWVFMELSSSFQLLLLLSLESLLEAVSGLKEGCLVLLPLHTMALQLLPAVSQSSQEGVVSPAAACQAEPHEELWISPPPQAGRFFLAASGGALSADDENTSRSPLYVLQAACSEKPGLIPQSFLASSFCLRRALLFVQQLVNLSLHK